MAGSNPLSNTSFGCAVLLPLPFAAVGVGTGVAAWRAARAGQWPVAGILVVFALVFGGAGVGLLIALAAGRKRERLAAGREAQHPNEPWLWNEAWAGGRIIDANKGMAVGGWLFAGAWNLIAMPIGFLAFREIQRHGVSPVLIALMFPLIGVGLLGWAIYATVRWLKFGVSVLTLETLPGVVGHQFVGNVHTGTVLNPESGLGVNLTCINRVTSGSGKSRSTFDHVVWREEQTIPVSQCRIEGAGSVVPCGFALPADARESNASNPRDRIVWQLQVSASLPGVDYSSSFEVPVFRTAESDTTLPEVPSPSVVPGAVAESYRQSAASRIRVQNTRRGTDIRFPPARNPGVAGSITVFWMVWSGVVGALVGFGAPLLFVGVFGLVDLVLLWSVLQLWLGTSDVHTDGTGVTVTTGLLGLGRSRNVPAAEVTSVTTEISMQAGTTPFYAVRLHTDGGRNVSRGRNVTLGGGIRDKREAEWLASLVIGALKARL